MQKEARPRIFLYQSVGFLAIIGLAWLDEVLGLSTLIFGNHPYIPEFRVSILVTLFTFGVWLLVTRATRRALERLRYLEGFMIVCAWCRRIEYHGQWMPLEEFLQQGFDTPTSHGICPECLDREKAAAERARLAGRKSNNHRKGCEHHDSPPPLDGTQGKPVGP